MIMLDHLKDSLEEIERKNEWEFDFVSNILQQREENPNKKLTGPQFKTLCRIHDKYC